MLTDGHGLELFAGVQSTFDLVMLGYRKAHVSCPVHSRLFLVLTPSKKHNNFEIWGSQNIILINQRQTFQNKPEYLLTPTLKLASSKQPPSPLPSA